MMLSHGLQKLQEQVDQTQTRCVDQIQSLESQLEGLQHESKRERLLYLQQEFRVQPSTTNQASLRTWRQLGPFDIVGLIDSGKLDYKPQLKVDYISGETLGGGSYQYSGQVDEAGSICGLGRRIITSGEGAGLIQEG